MAIKLDHAVLVTTATTALQQILLVTLSAAFNCKMMAIGSAYTAWSATEAGLGVGYIGTFISSVWASKFEQRFQNTDLDNNAGMSILPLGSGINFAIGDNPRAVCTPISTTSMRWSCSMWGEA